VISRFRILNQPYARVVMDLRVNAPAPGEWPYGHSGGGGIVPAFWDRLMFSCILDGTTTLFRRRKDLVRRFNLDSTDLLDEYTNHPPAAGATRCVIAQPSHSGHDRQDQALWRSPRAHGGLWAGPRL
jgi:hypothetical protein